MGIGNVLAGLGKHTEALAAFDAALERAPTDEAALRGRADVLVATGDRVRAAETLDRLAAALDASGRLAGGLDAARRALELAESRGRRDGVKAMVAERLPGRAWRSGRGEALVSAMRLLDRGRPPRASAVAEVRSASAATTRRRRPSGRREPAEPDRRRRAAVRSGRRHGRGRERRRRGDAVATRELALAAAAGHRDAGQLHAAIDVCYQALATSPADPGLHLTLAELYLDLGWRTTAADKLVLLARLAELGDDGDTRTRLCAVVAARLPDEPRLATLCA